MQRAEGPPPSQPPILASAPAPKPETMSEALQDLALQMQFQDMSNVQKALLRPATVDFELLAKRSEAAPNVQPTPSVPNQATGVASLEVEETLVCPDSQDDMQAAQNPNPGPAENPDQTKIEALKPEPNPSTVPTPAAAAPVPTPVRTSVQAPLPTPAPAPMPIATPVSTTVEAPVPTAAAQKQAQQQDMEVDHTQIAANQPDPLTALSDIHKRAKSLEGAGARSS